MRALLDVNFVIALLDSGHAFHDKAHAWWAANQSAGWASCAISENGVVRVMSNPGYRAQTRLSVSDVIAALKTFVSHTDHEFWDESISFREAEILNAQQISISRHLTDLYLLALAAKHNGTLVTFDRNIPLTAVRIAKPENLSVL